MNRRRAGRCISIAVALAAASSVRAFPLVEDAGSTTEPQEALVARIETGLLPAVQFRGVGSMTLRDRLDHYQAGALSLAVIDEYQVAWARAFVVPRLE